MNVHFIAIGGSAMHNLAIALARKGYQVTGSDDEIFEPSRGRLESNGLLPKKDGWFPENIHEGLDAIILGMHAREDNPELKKAQELGLKIYSYPEFVYEQTKDKTRIVVGGSHGKTTTTSMLLHVMAKLGISTDYLVGALLKGFDCMVQLSDAPYIVIEGDEYLSSPIDRRPKFHWYAPHVGMITGIAWDHINVFPTFENYVEQFAIYTDKFVENGHLIYFDGDESIQEVVRSMRPDINRHPYNTPDYKIKDGKTYLLTEDGEVALSIFGEHNLQNLNGARLMLNQIGVSNKDFYQAVADFKGASKRMEKVAETDKAVAYKDFAHSPSKLKATVKALKEQYPNRRLVACMELHTFSSLQKSFLPQYEGCMELADEALVYFNPDVVAHKRLEPLSKEIVANAFASDNVRVFTDSNNIVDILNQKKWDEENLLLMTSGNFHGLDLNQLAKDLIEK
ncbi:MAG: UDP-N-acetylmuramate--L-alanine ligase [Crocinitomicaceae bacterium]